MKNFKVGLQIYSLCDEMAKDMKKTLYSIKDMGYDYLELAGFYDMEAADLKGLLDRYDLKAISTHQNYEPVLEKPDKWIKDFKTLGLEYVAMPWMGLEKHKGYEAFSKTVSDFKKLGKLLEKNGIKSLYHNHDFEFNRKDGKFILEWLLEEVGDWLFPELDVCWVHYAGYRPDEYIRKYKGKLPVLHLKDFICTKIGNVPVYTPEKSDSIKYPDREKVGFEFRPVGYGVQNIQSILASAEEAGTKYLIVEQDDFVGIEPIEGVKMSRKYLKSLGI